MIQHTVATLTPRGLEYRGESCRQRDMRMAEHEQIWRPEKSATDEQWREERRGEG